MRSGISPWPAKAGLAGGFVRGAKRALLALLLAAAASALILMAAALLTRLPGEATTPSGLKRNEAVYVTMRDGVRIAVDVWLPENFASGETAAAILYQTRYQRAQDVGWLQRGFIGLGLAAAENQPGLPAQTFNDAGFVFVKVDARGSGASFGWRDIEMSPIEISDYGEIVQWIIEQSWSNGKVGAVGVSYSGNTAELLAATQHPSVKAVAPLYNDFDAQYGLVQPGGAKSAFLSAWGDMVGKMDRNDVCALAQQRGIACIFTRMWTSGVKPVDGHEGRRLLAAALKDHERNTPVADGFAQIEFRDDVYGSSGLTSAAVSGYGRRSEIEASNALFHVRTGWLDAATTDGALSRFRTFANPQQLVIGPYSHGGRTDSNPFAETDRPVSPPVPEQWKEVARFFTEALSAEGTAVMEKSIRYYTMGADIWRESSVWPPEGLSDITWHFGPDAALTEIAPEAQSGADLYIVDMTASSGEQTRWHTNLGLGDVVYPDRAGEDAKLLTYTSAPLTADVEITGTPVLILHVASSREDGVFHAYLEAVAPDGRVIYLTEGVLRGIHRKISDEPPAYVQDGPNHSFLRKDAAPMTPGEVMEIRIGLYATSLVVPENYRLRLSLAGADRSLFKPIPDGEPAEWTVYRNVTHPSRLVLPSTRFVQ